MKNFLDIKIKQIMNLTDKGICGIIINTFFKNNRNNN